MLTLEKFEEASEKVKEVVLPTNLIYSEYFSAQTGNKVYLKPENMQYTGDHHCIRRKSRTGCCLRSKDLWCAGYDRYANNHSFDQSKPYKELWSRSGFIWQCV